MKSAVIIKANDAQVFYSKLFIESLRDKNRGNYTGDIWIISTGLSNAAKYYAYENDIRVYVNEMRDLRNWKHFEPVAKAQDLFKYKVDNNYDNLLYESFKTYRNKRMSEFNIIGWSENFGNEYDIVAMCDCDILIQNDFNYIFEHCINTAKDKIYYQKEYNSIAPGTFLFEKILPIRQVIQ